MTFSWYKVKRIFLISGLNYKQILRKISILAFVKTIYTYVYSS